MMCQRLLIQSSQTYLIHPDIVPTVHSKDNDRVPKVIGKPNIQIWDVDLRGDRSLTLRHIPNQRKPLANNTQDVLKHVHRLWGFDVHLYSVDGNSVDNNEPLAEFHCPSE